MAEHHHMQAEQQRTSKPPVSVSTRLAVGSTPLNGDLGASSSPRLGRDFSRVPVQDVSKADLRGEPVQPTQVTGRSLDRAPAPLAIDRQNKPHAKVNLDLGWLDLSGDGLQTNGQLATVARLTIIALESDLEDVESDSVKVQANEWLQTSKGSLPFFDRHASEPIDESLVPLVNYQIDQLVAIRNAIQQDKVTRLHDALRRELRAAEAAAKEAEALQPMLDDAVRAAYRKGSTSSIKEVFGTVKSSLSIGSNLRTLALGITTDMHLLNLPVPQGAQMTIDNWSSQIGRVKVTIVHVSKYTDMLAKLGRGLARINIALNVVHGGKRATDVEQGMKDLSAVVNISTDLATLYGFSLPPHMSLMTTMWIKPALTVVSKQISLLVEHLSDANRISVAITGDLMYPETEPGGQEMFDLMVAVMHASDLSGVPEIRGRVTTYLYDHRKKLEAGTDEPVPTKGWLWKDLDSLRARAWLFSHRQRVWVMFYGSMEVPTRSRR
ncbi:hypothetical protein LR392_04935 [Arthrobacter sp. AK04]|uniref:hypothetical protein n=1 Tax=Arthrobacter sp. AK04 TaxID=2900048 RepID=UPI001E2DE595|nr:hypothetical protein [Arthrobacter sp. AK04]MCD5341573.1 hypothetical protein [Arthrobacter sp. AK04]